MKIIYKLSEIDDVAKKIINNTNSKTLLFYGDMGVGKTTLIKRIAFMLGITDITSSPTFSIVNEYGEGENTIYHFDFYRLNDENEAYDIGIEDYFYEKKWNFIEWPEKVNIYIFPEKVNIIEINSLEDGSRSLIMK